MRSMLKKFVLPPNSSPQATRALALSVGDEGRTKQTAADAAADPAPSYPMPVSQGASSAPRTLESGFQIPNSCFGSVLAVLALSRSRPLRPFATSLASQGHWTTDCQLRPHLAHQSVPERPTRAELVATRATPDRAIALRLSAANKTVIRTVLEGVGE